MKFLFLISAALLSSFFVDATNVSKAECVHKHPAGTHKLTLNGRYFLLLVPDRLDLKPAPIVVDVPGFSESPYYQKELTGIDSFLEQYGWIGAIPFGTASKATDTCCPEGTPPATCESGVTLDKQNPCSFNAGSCCGVAASRNVADVEFMRSIVQYIEANMCGDVKNVFATGFSNGGMMSNRLICEASDMFKAVAPVAGNLVLASGCRQENPTGWLSFCGTEDNCDRGHDALAREVAERNRCAAGDPIPSFTTETTKCFRYEGCSAMTEYCSIIGLPHEWPGRERPDGTSPKQPATNVDATSLIFDRFSELVE